MSKPAAFTPQGAPDGVEIKSVSYTATRPTIVPRLLLVHTNAASGEGSMNSSSNWAEAKPGENTLPHYQVDRAYNSAGFIARKMLPTSRKGVGNGTVSSSSKDWPKLAAAQRASITAHGPAAMFSLVVETADLGYGAGKPGDNNVFTDDQAEMVARIIAYESIVWSFPIAYPDAWYGAGVACHTEPFEYPYWSTYTGKTCPGAGKKAQMRDLILPRARAIRAEWTDTTPPAPHPDPLPPDPPQEDDDMSKALLITSPGGSRAVAPAELTTKSWLDGDSYNALLGTGQYAEVTLSQADFDRIPVSVPVDIT